MSKHEIDDAAAEETSPCAAPSNAVQTAGQHIVASTATVTLPRANASARPFDMPPCFSAEAGIFSASTLTPMVSSDRKHVYRGALVRPDGTSLPAVAALFIASDISFYAEEVSSLARNQLLCVGPEIYQLVQTVSFNNEQIPCILEEDAGASLEDALFLHAPVPGAVGTDAAPLSPIGTPERDTENKKILYDVLDQVERLHSHGLYHRDIRAANICVRRYGSEPRDIHAILIDHELVTSYTGSDVPASAERYSGALFKRIPHEISPAAPPIRPTSLMRDMGYLAALRFELETEMGIERARASDLAWGRRPLFRYTNTGSIVMRRLERAGDLDPLACNLGLTSLTTGQFADMQSVTYALQHVAPGGYLDARAKAILERRATFLTQAPIDALARSASYQAWLEACRRAGRTPEYETFDTQPKALQESNRDQVRDIPEKLDALGYRIVRNEDAGPNERIAVFADEEIEELAFLEHRRWHRERLQQGWVAGSPRNDELRIHPDLIPYDELPEQSKEYDRAAVRIIIPILERAGFCVIR